MQGIHRTERPNRGRCRQAKRGLTSASPALTSSNSASYSPRGPQGRTDPDDAPEPPAHPVAEPGDLWVLGRHRLLCGDSTVASDVERVLGGVAPHLMVTGGRSYIDKTDGARGPHHAVCQRAGPLADQANS